MLEQELLSRQKAYFASGETLDINKRIISLLQLKQAVQSHEQDVLSALKMDFSKCPFDTYTTELLLVLNEIDSFVNHLEKWSKPKRTSAGIFNFSVSWAYLSPAIWRGTDYCSMELSVYVGNVTACRRYCRRQLCDSEAVFTNFVYCRSHSHDC